MHADGAENCTEDRSGTAVPVLAVLHLPGASLDVGCAIVVRLHLLDEGVELALDTTEAAQYVGDVGGHGHGCKSLAAFISARKPNRELPVTLNLLPGWDDQDLGAPPAPSRPGSRGNPPPTSRVRSLAAPFEAATDDVSKPRSRPDPTRPGLAIFTRAISRPKRDAQIDPRPLTSDSYAHRSPTWLDHHQPGPAGKPTDHSVVG
jgi:hypothetical protein